MSVQRILIHPTYKKENGFWSLNTQAIDMPPEFHIAQQNIVYIPPLAVGGNHIHPRKEIFLGIGKELYLRWQDEGKTIHEDLMNPDENLYLFFVESFIPHAVINKSSNTAGILYEYADDVQHDVVKAQLI